MGFIKISPDPTPPWEVLSISWDLQTKIMFRHNFYIVFWRNQASPGFLVIFKIVRVSSHFSSSRAIQLDLSTPHPSMWSSLHLLLSLLVQLVVFGSTFPPPLQENFSWSRGIPRDEKKWGGTLLILKIPKYGENFSGVLVWSNPTRWRDPIRFFLNSCQKPP